MKSSNASEAQALDALVAAYPDAVASRDGERIVWRDGTVMAASDGLSDKSFKLIFYSTNLQVIERAA